MARYRNPAELRNGAAFLKKGVCFTYTLAVFSSSGTIMNLVCVAILFMAAADQAATMPLNPATTQDTVDRALQRMFNADFTGANTLITEEIRNHPENPFLYSLRAAALLFSEFSRMQILELDFFADDESLTNRKRLNPDRNIRADFFQAIGHARALSSARLAIDPKDVNASYALFVAAGVETDYTLLVEKSYRRGYSLSKETQKYANRLLGMNPPIYDAYLSSGMLEYGVGNLNWFFRLFIRFDRISGNKQKAIEYLKLVIDHGRYYSTYAKILLSVIYLRDRKPEQALDLLKELERDFPENTLIQKEVLRISAKIGSTQSGKSSR
jgi:tetratricopeptide (TPR) repeat protein